MVLEKPPSALKRFFPLIAAALFFLIRFASFLKLTHLPMFNSDYVMLGDQGAVPGGVWQALWPIIMVLKYLIVVSAIMYLVVAFFAVLGSFVGERLKELPSLSGYGVNLAGSLTGIFAFTALSYLCSMLIE